MEASGFTTVVSIILPALLFFGVYHLYKKGLTVRELLFKGNVVLKFEMLAIISTLIEVANLTTIAMDRGVPVGSAAGRYVTVGALEIIASACFIEAFAFQVRSATKDGKIEVFEILRMIIVALPVLAIASMVTHGIAVLYMESLDIISAVPTGNIFGKLFNIIVTSTGQPMGGLGSSVDAAGKLELGALFIIYNTILLNILLIPLNLWKEIQARKKRNADKDSKQGKDKSDPKASSNQKKPKDSTYKSKQKNAQDVLDLVEQQMSGK